MNLHEQLRTFRGDVEVGTPPSPQQVLSWAQEARPYCAQCAAQPLYEVDGDGLSGRTRARAIIDQAMARGIIARIRQVHCEHCPPAEVVVQLGVLGLLASLPLGEAWCLRYAFGQPGVTVVSPSVRRGTRYGTEWLDPSVCHWLEANVTRWGWSLADWQGALVGLPVEVQHANTDLLLTVDLGRCRLRWHPGLRVRLERLDSLRPTMLEPLEAVDEVGGGQLGVDLLSSEELASRGVGKLIRPGVLL